jgi:hypothetical protein
MTLPPEIVGHRPANAWVILDDQDSHKIAR